MTARKMETKNERRMSGLWKDVTIVPGENINIQSTALMRNMILHSIWLDETSFEWMIICKMIALDKMMALDRMMALEYSYTSSNDVLRK